jgi:hypothetical protein
LHTINVGKTFSKQNNWQQQTHKQTPKLLIEEKVGIMEDCERGD